MSSAAIPKLNSLIQLYAGVPDAACDKLKLQATLRGRTTVVDVAVELPLSTGPKKWLESLAESIVDSPAFTDLEERRRQDKAVETARKLVVDRGVSVTLDFVEYSKARFRGIKIVANDHRFFKSVPRLIALDTEGRPEVRLAQVYDVEARTVHLFDHPLQQPGFVDLLMDPNVLKVVCDKTSELRALGLKTSDQFEKARNGVSAALNSHLRACNLTGKEGVVCSVLEAYLGDLDVEQKRFSSISASFIDIQAGRPDGRKALTKIIEDVFEVSLNKPEGDNRTVWGVDISPAQLEYAAYDAVWNWELYNNLQRGSCQVA